MCKIIRTINRPRGSMRGLRDFLGGISPGKRCLLFYFANFNLNPLSQAIEGKIWAVMLAVRGSTYCNMAVRTAPYKRLPPKLHRINYRSIATDRFPVNRCVAGAERIMKKRFRCEVIRCPATTFAYIADFAIAAETGQ
jgi:hypothetical protein